MSTEGNGKDRIEVSVSWREDWIMFAVAEPRHAGQAAINGMSQGIRDWLDANPKCRVRAALPFIVDGQTIAIQLWYDGSMSAEPVKK